VADGDRLGHLRQLHGPASVSGQGGIAHQAGPGWNLQVVDANNKQVAPGEIGALVVKLPLPPGTLPTLWQNDARYVESYLEEFPGLLQDRRRRLYRRRRLRLRHGRTDDIINVAGHRLSTGAMEEVLVRPSGRGRVRRAGCR
jgi:propionyl-CoA synthetase